MTPEPGITDTTRLRLCPIIVKGGAGNDHYVVINREGREVISTSKAGVDAIRLLARGRTVGQARRILGDRYRKPAEEIDLAPLLATLLASGFVRFLDGRQIASDATGGQGLRIWFSVRVWGPLLERAFRVLPPGLALRLAYRCLATAANPEQVRRIVENLHRAPGLDQSAHRMARIAADNCRALRKQFCDRLLLTSVPPRRLRAWLCGMRITGFEQLTLSAANGNGVILCSFHFGSYGLIPFVLGAMGIPVTVYGGFREDARSNVDAWLADHLRRGDEYPVRFVGGPMALRALVQSLQRGEVVLLYCDRAPGAGGSQHMARVPFLGTHVWSARGAGWLRHRTGAAVLPAVLPWEGRPGHHLRIGAELTGFSEGAEPGQVDAVMVAVYAALEGYVRQYPGQWLRWPDFGGMVAPDA